jgi:tetratricopeptide (TPR) repeat protein
VPIDRTRTLRQAEKLLRQGRLDAAIAEYRRVLDEFPQDWTTANALGDCYYRAHQADAAVEQYLRIADHLAREGLAQPAAALYKKILKIKPDHDHALWQAAALAAAQGAVAEARQWLSTLAELRESRGDAAGAAEVLVRLGSLDPADLDARLAAAQKALDTGGAEQVAAELRELVDALIAARRGDDAIGVLERATTAVPGDATLRGRLARAWAERGEFDRARLHASSAAEFVQLADACAARGDADGEIAMLIDARRASPEDPGILLRLVREYADRGDYAAACLHLDGAGDTYDGELFAAAGEVRARAGDTDRARLLFARMLAREPHRTGALIEQGLRLTEPELALLHVEAAAEAQLARGDMFGAIAAYRRFAEAFPAYHPGLVRLVDVSVDAGLDQETADAQARLAEAYLASGRAAEARVIAEDLLSRFPADPQHENQLRRVLVALGEKHVDALIAERLNTGNVLGFEEIPPGLDEASRIDGAPAPAGEGPPPAASPGDGPAPDQAAGVPGVEPAPGASAETFKSFHEDASTQSLLSQAEQHYQIALAYEEAGLPVQAMNELREAVRSPLRRFEAAAMLGRLSRETGHVDEAIDWFERAAEAPAPSIDACRKLLYDLGDTLDAAGEHQRALAVFTELQAESGSYRDVGRRIDRLTRAGAGSGG